MSGSNKKIIGSILFSYYEESLVPSNLNSKLFRFYSAHLKVQIILGKEMQKFLFQMQMIFHKRLEET